MEIKYQSLEQLQEDGLTVSAFCAIDKEKNTARPIVYQIIRSTYKEALTVLVQKVKCAYQGIKVNEGFVRGIFGIESKLTEDNQVLVMGQLGSYKPHPT